MSALHSNVHVDQKQQKAPWCSSTALPWLDSMGNSWGCYEKCAVPCAAAGPQGVQQGGQQGGTAGFTSGDTTGGTAQVTAGGAAGSTAGGTVNSRVSQHGFTAGVEAEAVSASGLQNTQLQNKCTAKETLTPVADLWTSTCTICSILCGTT